MGLGRRAGHLVIGAKAVRESLQRDLARMVIVAADTSSRTEEKVIRLALARGVPVVEAPSADVLGHALGAGPLQAVGVRDRRLAEGLGQHLEGSRRS